MDAITNSDLQHAIAWLELHTCANSRPAPDSSTHLKAVHVAAAAVTVKCLRVVTLLRARQRQRVVLAICTAGHAAQQ